MAELNPRGGPYGVVWRVASLGEVDKYRPLLGDEEAGEAAVLRCGRLRDRYVVARGLRRELLAECLRRDSGALTFATAEEGKPLLADAPGWDFNLSHSGDFVVVAVRKGAVGVDLEQIRGVREMERLVERYFHMDEVSAWQRLAEPLKIEGFFKLWTAREAAMKCAGLGLARGLAQTRVDPAYLSLGSAHVEVGPAMMRVIYLPVLDGYVMTLAVGL